MGNDRLIAEAAWTSSLDLIKKEAKNEDDVKRIVNLLADEKHSVPFESVIFRFWIRLPIQTDRQHVTHRIASHSGMSGRYRTMPNEWLKVPEDVSKILESADINKLIEGSYDVLCEKANEWYNNTLKYMKYCRENEIITPEQYKRVREFVRGVLPQNNMTERVTVMNLRSFANYYKLRAKSNAQLEIQDIANKMLEQITINNICPIAIDALIRNDWNI